MNSFIELYRSDLYRYGGGISTYLKRFHWLFRKCQCTQNRAALMFYRFLFRKIKKKNGIEIYGGTKIGKGLYIGHPYCITINADAIIGANCNLSKGVTIGAENRGKRKGAPIIGSNVWFGVGSVVVGHINIGDDVMIAPNAYVNCDVPSHSIVLGNPCRIVHRDNATESYIDNTV